MTSMLMSYRERGVRKRFYLLCAWLCLALAVAGAFLPLLPTTPFLLCCVWLSVKADSGLAHWLVNHHRFGPPIRRWQSERTLARSTKWLATTMITANWLLLWVLGASLPLLAALTAGFCAALVMIWRIPTARPGTGTRESEA
ncbi:YbaN family protein [Microbulbifer sp. JSM ZJ756]|uniref:YbaN family protein n=1 Tax=Microbulbifer sp. JSM ZJ756 TaxID=3376191 RepID=UPI00379B66F3